MAINNSLNAPWANVASLANAYGVVVAGASGTAAIDSLAVGTAGQVLTSAGAGAHPTWSTPTGISSWVEVTGTSGSLVAFQGVIANNAGLVTLTLPGTAALGDEFSVCYKGAGGWRVAQNASQSIGFGNQTTTVGAGGYLEFTAAGDAVHFLCTTANTGFRVLSAVGNLTVA